MEENIIESNIIKIYNMFKPKFLINKGMNHKKNGDVEFFEIADLKTCMRLKKQGFDYPTYYYWLDNSDIPYVEKGLKRVKMGKKRMNHNKYDMFIYSAPSKEQVMKWLKKH